MRYLALFCGLTLLVTASIASADPKFVMESKGLVIDNGGMGRFVIAPPSLTIGKNDEKPVYTLKSATEATVQYPSGLQLAYAIKGKQASLHYTNAATGTKNFKFVMSVPMSYNQGGQYAFDTGDLKPLPAEKGGQFVDRGNHTSFSLIDPSNQSFTLVTPGGYQELQDNRTWGTQAFGYHYYCDTTGKKEGFFTFTVKDRDGAEAEVVKPTVDKFGQNMRKEFDGKVKSEDELKADAAKQTAEAAAFKADSKFDQYGGLAGSGAEYKLEKNGFFHVGTANGRQVLVDPEGNVFFQLGMCGIARTDDDTTVKGREKIYEWLPPKDGDWVTAWRESRPDYGIMSFYVANLIRKFEKPWTLDEWSGQVVSRLRQWGFNSAGAFCASTPSMKAAGFPTVSFLPLGKGGGVEVLPDKIGAGDLMDPFVPGTEEALEKKFAKGVADRATDPLLIGYFLGNEQHFEILPKLIPTYKASKVAAKAKLVEMLQEKYKEIDAFNKAWNPATPFADFDAIKDASLFIRTDAGNADMLAYYKVYLDTYYAMVQRVFRKYDPNHLLIGSRWTPGTANNKDAVEIGSKYLDVISINYYTYSIDKPFLNMVYERSGHKPMIFSEWHYCTSSHGLAARMEVKDEKERGMAYRNYTEQSAALPYVVGNQWFIYTDQAITGRFFEGFHGEGNNTGFVDVTDRPYTDLVEAAKITNARIYDVMLGKTQAYAFEDPRFDGKSVVASNKTIQVPKAIPGMKLDGTTSGWPGRPAEPIESSRLVLGKPNPALRGDYRMAWDENNLYFHIQIKDPTPLMSNKKGGSMWSADGVELFIGPNDLASAGNMIFSDRQILIGGSATPSVFIIDHAEDSKLCTVVSVKDVSGDGYVLMVTIPWKAINAEPKAEQEMLFDVAIDNSDDGDARVQQLAWNGTGQNSHDRKAWGKMKISEN